MPDHLSQAFSSVFYLTAAAVIPVLLLAIAAQARGRQRPHRASTSGILASLIVTAGTAAELAALLALQARAATAAARITVIVGAIVVGLALVARLATGRRGPARAVGPGAETGKPGVA